MNVDNLVNPELLKLREMFQAEGFDIQFVGGCVRDTLLELTPNDIDLCTDATPSEQVAIYKKNNMRWIETGMQHGTTSVVLNDVVYEITSLRTDVETDGRHAKVAYTRDWVLDLQRRDLTFNAMMVDFDGILTDPFGGESDLENGLVKFVGHADTRIKEDYLRILRWFRFRGRFETTIDFGGEIACDSEYIESNAHMLVHISRERVWSEVKKIISGRRGQVMMRSIHELNVAQHCGIKCDNPNWYLINKVFHRTQDPITLMVALYGDDATAILTGWKASSAEINKSVQLIHIINNDLSLTDSMAVYNIPRDVVVEAAILLRVSKEEEQDLRDWTIPVFPVTGQMLLDLGMKPGPKVGKILGDLKNLWARQGYNLDVNLITNFSR